MNIVIIGTGNVATNLAFSFAKSNIKISQLIGRNKEEVKKIGNKLKIPYNSDYNKINSTADAYIIAISDDYIKQISAKKKLKNKLIIHTSGTKSIEEIQSDKKGVLYPVQTMKKDKLINFNNVPVCIESNNEESLNLIRYLANILSKNVQEINSHQRKTIHLAAVMVNNFSNHMFCLGKRILEKEKLSFDILKPLISSTCENAMEDPEKSQTGPSVRRDKTTIKEHLEILNTNKDLRKLYKFISESIEKHGEKL